MPTSLVTGSNRGIGLELCRQLLARGHQVVAACRESGPDLAALGARVEPGIDVTSDAAVSALADRLRKDGVRLDVVILNAGVLEPEPASGTDRVAKLDLAAVERQLKVNALGPLRVVRALLDRFAPSAKLAIITSLMGSVGDNGSGGYYGYRMSKAAVNMAGASLAHDLRGRGIAVALLHPGYVKTDMTRGQGNVSPADAARGLLARIDELTLATSGKFWHANGKELPW
ncbi:MAG TPA: SDR family oxidoreductase [Haliangiales bacterium]|nr:SDR family oxidoreductase [Haliangiales bacterium]